MKQILIFSFLLVSMITYTSCDKDEAINQAAKNAAEAEFRLAGVKKWILTDAKINDEYILKDKVLLDPEQNGLAEWLSFDTDDKTVEVKYRDGDETIFFDYIIVGDVFKVRHKDGEEEVLTIKSGSVFVDYFTMIQTIENDIAEFTLRVE